MTSNRAWFLSAPFQSDDESICGICCSAAWGPASNDGDVPLPMLIPAGDLDGAPVAPTEGRRKRKRAVHIEGPRTLFFIFGKSDGWLSKTFNLGDGANVDLATRLVCVAFGSWRLVSRNDETSHDSEVCMRDSAEKLLGRFAPHFLLYCASLVA